MSAIGRFLASVGRPAGAFPPEILLLFAAVLAVSALGFLRTVYFVSLGYGFSVAVQAAILGLLHAGRLGVPAALHLGLLALYGLRLGTYLAIREARPAYARELKDASSRSAGTGAGKKALIWAGVSVLYVLMVSPGLYHARAASDGRTGPAGLAWAGLAVMAAGLAIETAADLQKAAYKTAHPDRFCDVGLYRIVRCPNYFGEILVWTGSLLAGAGVLRGVFPWAAGLVGWLCIVLIMMGSAKRLETRQRERYGDREDYRAFASRVPVLFPLVPVYTLENVKVYLE